MRRPGLRDAVVVVVPPLVLAAAGLAHPMRLTDATADRWVVLHLVALPLFPLLGLAPWLITRRSSTTAGVVAALLGYAYAACYTGLDVLAGIGAGQLQRHHAAAQKGILYDQADALAAWGVAAYLAASLLAVAVALRRSRSAPALSGAVLVLVGAASFLTSHIYWPRGVATMLALAAGWGLLAIGGRGEPGRGDGDH